MVRPATAKFGRPRMPSALLAARRWRWLARIAAVGNLLDQARRRTPAWECGRSRCGWRAPLAKSGCASVQPVARRRGPVIVNSACTPPSGVPSGCCTNRASRTGPFSGQERRHAVACRRPSANATCGLIAGLVPPIAGCEWQPPQLSRFMRGPSPSSTSSASSKSSLPARKYSFSLLSQAGERPAGSGGPPRTPGSFAWCDRRRLRGDLDLECQQADDRQREEHRKRSTVGTHPRPDGFPPLHGTSLIAISA